MSSQFITAAIIAICSLPCCWSLANSCYCLVAGPPQCRRAMFKTIGVALGILISGILWFIAALKASYVPLIFVADVADMLLALALVVLSQHDEYDSYSWPLAFGYTFISIAGTCWYLCFIGIFPSLLIVGISLLNLAVIWMACGLLKDAIPSLARLYAQVLERQRLEEQRRQAYYVYELPVAAVRQRLF